jgi:hypothetical protein
MWIISCAAGAYLRILACFVEADALQRRCRSRPAPPVFAGASLAVNRTSSQTSSCQ